MTEAVEILDYKIENAIKTLNEGQLTAFNLMLDFLKDDQIKFFTLAGFAGTGKTYVISRLLEVIQGEVAATAPTNKAVKVLSQSSFGSNKIHFATIYKLLALRMRTWYPPKGSKAVPKLVLSKDQYKTPTIKLYDVVIIDESSMLPDEIFLLINKISGKAKIIFMGDQAQVPPVNKDDSLPLVDIKHAPILSDNHSTTTSKLPPSFYLNIYKEYVDASKEGQDKKERTKYHKFCTEEFDNTDKILQDGMFSHKLSHEVSITYYTLSQSMRQSKDSGILEVANSIRDNRWTYDNAIFDRKDKSDTFFYSSINQIDKLSFMRNMFKCFLSKEFEDDADFVKVLAWRNKTVDGLSLVIRKQIFKGKKLERFMVGEKLIASNPIMQGSSIVFNTSDEFTVKDIHIRKEVHKYPQKEGSEKQLSLSNELTIKASDKDTTLQYYELDVESTLITQDEDEPIVMDETIHILHESSKAAYDKLLRRYASIEDWQGWSRLKESFAQVTYNYCITVHKAQGSSYKNVFVIEDDIDMNRKVLEKNRIKYTAVSRASKKLHLLTRHA
jgi:ATP-dependent exoDNAse (exonuclease V) alpha subunit